MILHADTLLRKIRRTLLVAVPFQAWTHLASAQRVIGPSDDATVLPRGMARVTVSPTWSRYHERFADGLGPRARGRVEPLAADFDLDSVGPSVLPALSRVDAELRSILGSTSPLALTAGRVRARFDASISYTPIAGEFGITNRVTLGMLVPLVKTRTEVLVNPNPTGLGATVGFNPALTSDQARYSNAEVTAQLTAAAALLQQRLQACSGSTDPSCAAINANRPGAQQLVASAGAAATGIENVYGVSAAKRGSAFAPVHRSAVQQSVEGRLASLSDAFETFLGAPGGGAEWISAQPIGAAPLAYADFTRLLSDSAGGILADTLQSVERNTIGDMEFGAKVLLFDSFRAVPAQRATLGGVRLRLSVAALYRLGTGQIESPTNFADIGTGDAQDDIEARVFADVMLGRKFWASFVGRYGMQREDEQIMRVPAAPHQPFPPASRQFTLRRDLGDYTTAEVSPRIVLSETIAFSGTYVMYSKGADSYAFAPGSAPDPDSASVVDPGVLALGSERMEQRVLASLTYSNLAAYYRNRARIPMEVSLTIGRTLAGEGNAPKASITSLSFRFYNRVFGQ